MEQKTLSQEVFGSKANMNHDYIIEIVQELGSIDEKRFLEELIQLQKQRQK